MGGIRAIAVPARAKSIESETRGEHGEPLLHRTTSGHVEARDDHDEEDDYLDEKDDDAKAERTGPSQLGHETSDDTTAAA